MAARHVRFQPGWRTLDGELDLAGESRPDQPDILQSTVLPLTFRLIPGDPRPGIEVRHTDGVQEWLA